MSTHERYRKGDVDGFANHVHHDVHYCTELERYDDVAWDEVQEVGRLLHVLRTDC